MTSRSFVGTWPQINSIMKKIKALAKKQKLKESWIEVEEIEHDVKQKMSYGGVRRYGEFDGSVMQPDDYYRHCPEALKTSHRDVHRNNIPTFTDASKMLQKTYTSSSKKAVPGIHRLTWHYEV